MQKNTVWPEIMSLKIIGYVIHNISLPPTQKLVLIVLADFYNEKRGKAWPSQDTLCDVTGLSLRSINRALSELKKRELITIWKERSSGQYPHNVYRINHVSERHMVLNAAAKNEHTTCQKGTKPYATVAHNPLGTLKKPLNKDSDKGKRNLLSPETPEQFQDLPGVMQDHCWYHKPNVQRMLRRAGLKDLKTAKNPPPSL